MKTNRTGTGNRAARALTLTLLAGMATWGGMALAQERGGRGFGGDGGPDRFEQRGPQGGDRMMRPDRPGRNMAPGYDGAGMGMGMGMGMPGHLTRMLTLPGAQERLGLTDEQVESIRELTYAKDKERIALQSEAQQVQLELRHEMSVDTPDREAVMDLIERQGGLQTEMMKLQMGEMFDVRDLLTPEQFDMVRQFRPGLEREGLGRQRPERMDRGQRGPGRPGEVRGPGSGPGRFGPAPEDTNAD